jgi:hypothetical protein
VTRDRVVLSLFALLAIAGAIGFGLLMVRAFS